MKLYWGDLHVHTGISYGRGKVEACVENGESHVDFIAVVGHAFWHDLHVSERDPGGIAAMHYGGFSKLQALWPEALEKIRKLNRPQEFVVFPGYEWHSAAFGDYNVIYRKADASAELLNADSPSELKEKIASRTAFVLPHHIGYIPASRSMDWDAFTEKRSPVVEVCSAHGEFDADDGGAYGDIYSVMGPRVDSTCVTEGLKRGFRFGFMGGSDSHTSFPASFTTGRMGIYAESLTPEALWEAIKARRTLAARGDNIRIEFEAVGAGIGEETKVSRKPVDLHGRIIAEDAIETVEVFRNGQAIRVFHPSDEAAAVGVEGEIKVRLQVGWGNLDHAGEWEGRVVVEDGELLEVTPYFESNEAYRNNIDGILFKGGLNRVESVSDRDFSFRCMACGFPQQYVMRLAARPNTRLRLESDKVKLSAEIEKLSVASQAKRGSEHGSTAAKFCRAVPKNRYLFEFRIRDDVEELPEAWYHVRVTEKNRCRGWCSPVWVEFR